MKRTMMIWLTIAAVLTVLGALIFVAAWAKVGFDFRKLSLPIMEERSLPITQGFDHIQIDTKTADVTILSTGEQCRVVLYDGEKLFHEATVQDGVLKISLNDERNWYDYIGFFSFSPKITVYLPEKEYGNLTVDATTGDIEIEGVLVDEMNLSVNMGDVEVQSVDCRGDLSVKVTTGDTDLEKVRCKNLLSDGSMGDLELEDVIASERFSLKRSTGDIEFENCDASEIEIKTSTGSVRGSLLSEKIFITDTSTGKVVVPESISGGKCKIETSTGNIKIQMVK